MNAECLHETINYNSNDKLQWPENANINKAIRKSIQKAAAAFERIANTNKSNKTYITTYVYMYLRTFRTVKYSNRKLKAVHGKCQSIIIERCWILNDRDVGTYVCTIRLCVCRCAQKHLVTHIGLGTAVDKCKSDHKSVAQRLCA